VGAGITGLSTALHLAERGARVIVLEAEDPGFGASGRNGGQVNAGLKHDPDDVERDFGRDLGGRMNSLSALAPSFVFSLIERHGIACEARRNGTLRAAIRARHAIGVAATAEQWQRRGAPVHMLQGAALAAATGTGRYAAAMWDKRGGDLNPLSYVRGLMRVVVKLGGVVHGATRVTGIAPRGGVWGVHTAAGTVTAEQVVIATNGYTDSLWPTLGRSIVPVFGAVAATEPLPDAIAGAVMPGRAVLYESGAVTVYYRVDASQRLLIGGRGPQREIDSPAAVANLLNYAAKLWPGIRGVAWTHAWGGRLAMTRDHYPHVHEPARGILVCLGYNGRGVAMASAMGAQIANRLLDPAARFDMPLTDIRSIAFHALWPLAVRAVIARAQIMDFVGR
jgi:glycine/D-amino acid oxidase-like deaminating enzyme